MPKLKTKSGLKKRVKATASGKLKRGYTHKRHLMRNRNKSMRRSARGMTTMAATDTKKILRFWLPYAN